MLRYEYKYYVPYTNIDRLRDMIAPHMELDPFAAKQPGRAYTVRSIYFDTPSFECYHTKVAGTKHRYKLRIRGYNEGGADDWVFLEIKRKYEAPIMKHRAPFAFKRIPDILSGGDIPAHILRPNRVDDARRFMYRMLARRMRPVVTVIYEREPFLGRFDDPDNNLRITFDKHLRSVAYPAVEELYEERDVRVIMGDYLILEVKFNKYMPAWVRPVIQTLALRKEPASKYVLCIDGHPNIRPDARHDTFVYDRLHR